MSRIGRINSDRSDPADCESPSDQADLSVALDLVLVK
jgi:hypothetical protein